MKATPTNSNTVVADYLYRIAIDGLPIETECLRQGGIYLINVDEWDDCMLLTKQLLSRVPSNKQGVLVSTTNATDSINRLQETHTEIDFGRVRFIDPTVTALKAMTADLKDAIRPFQRTILLLLPASVVNQLTQALLRTLLSKWQPWLLESECALLILSVSSESALNSAQMLENNDFLSGLSYLERTSATEFIYRIQHWRSAIGVSAAKSLQLSQRSGSLRVHALDTSSSFSFATRRRPGGSAHVIEQAALKDFGYAKESGWIVLSTREAVYEYARKHVDITVVFALNHYKELPEIARLLHALRLERGPMIRLLVREVSTQLRMQDEQKLLDCGANLMLSGNLSYLRFKSLLDSIQTLRYTRQLLAAHDNLFDQEERLDTTRENQGVVTVEVFLEQCRSKIAESEQQRQGDTAGVLVCLQPVPGLSASQLLAQVILRRHEDLATDISNKIYLFLYGCPPELVPAVLRQLFRLPVEDIFVNQTVYEDAPSIQAQLQRLKNDAAQAGWQPTTSQAEFSDENINTQSAELELMRYSPKRASLILS